MVDGLKKFEKQVIQLQDEIAQRVADKYQVIFNLVDEGFALCELLRDENGNAIDLRYLEVNPAYEKHRSVKAEELIGHTALELHPDLDPTWIQTYAAVVDSKTPAKFERQFDNRWYDIGAYSVKENYFVILLKDITDRKKAEETLLESQQLLHDDLEDAKKLQHISNLIIEESDIEMLNKEIMDASMDIMNADMASLQILHPEKDRLFLQAWKNFHPRSADLWEWVDAGSGSVCGAALEKNKRIIVQNVEDWDFIKNKKDLEPFHLSGIRAIQSTPLVSRSGKCVGMLSTHWKQPHQPTERELSLFDALARQAADLVEKRKADEALRNRDEQLHVLNTSLEQQVAERTDKLRLQHNILKQAEELARVGSWEYNVQTKEFIWSEGMYKLFNLPKDETLTPGIYLDHVLEDDWPIAKKIVDSIQENFEPFEETIRIRFDGSVRSLRIKAAPLKSQHGEVEKMLGADLDVTKLIQLNASLSEMNRVLSATNRELQYSNDKVIRLNKSVIRINDQLNSANAELRNFSSITTSNYTEALRHVYINLETIVTTDARNLSNSSRANLRRAQAAIQKMKLLTTDINNYLQLYESRIRTEVIDPHTIFLEVANGLKTKIEESNAQIKIAQLPELRVDRDLFSRLMFNLIDNAIKFRKPDTDPVIMVNYSIINQPINSNDRNHIAIEIADNGFGFENTDKIFEIFTQLEEHGKHKGSGMGLAICKKIMEMHGGFITAESKPGEGSVFSCYFPPRGYNQFE